MEKGNNTIGMLLAAFVCLFLGLALIGVVATQTNDITDLVPSQETLSIQGAKTADGATLPYKEMYLNIINDSRGGWRASLPECTIASLVQTMSISNGSKILNSGNYSISAVNGSIRFLNTHDVNWTVSNVTYVSYNKCPDNFVSGWAGNMLVLVPGFFALALLGCAIALFYQVAKETGIL